jgi:hypothetical protein
VRKRGAGGRHPRLRVKMLAPARARVLRRGDHWLVCTRERKPDAFGRPRTLDPLCGRPKLAR